jgi:hypothetical protein
MVRSRLTRRRMDGEAVTVEGTWADCRRAVRRLLRASTTRVAVRTPSALTRARWAIVVALAAGIAALVLGPALVRHTVGGGDCTGHWELAGAHVDTNGNLVIDPVSCSLTGFQTTAVWVTALAVALIGGITTARLARR